MKTRQTEQQTRVASGRFARGKSGNPKGRPKGSRNKSSEVLEALKADVDRQAENPRKRALEGDPTAMKIYWERVLPKPAGRCVEFELPVFREAYDFHDAQMLVLWQVADGRLTPADGLVLADLIEKAEQSYWRAMKQLDQEAGDVTAIERMQYLRIVEPQGFKKSHEAGLFPGSEKVMNTPLPFDQDDLIMRCQQFEEVYEGYLRKSGRMLPSRPTPEQWIKALEIVTSPDDDTEEAA